MFDESRISHLPLVVTQWLKKRYTRYLFKKTLLDPILFNTAFPTILKYSHAIRVLSKKGYNQIVEVAPGNISLPALSIKATFLSNDINYIAIEKDQCARKNLIHYLTKINVKHKIIPIPFQKLWRNEVQETKGNSIYCFEHSFDDIVIDELYSYYSLSPTHSWDHMLAYFNNFSYDMAYDVTIDECLLELGEKLIKYFSNKNIVVIIHNFISPRHCDNSFLHCIDSKVVKWSINFIMENGRYSYINISGNNYPEEYFWAGRF